MQTMCGYFNQHVFIFFSFPGQSPIDFLFDFVEVSQGLFNGFDALDSRPRAGKGIC